MTVGEWLSEKRGCEHEGRNYRKNTYDTHRIFFSNARNNLCNPYTRCLFRCLDFSWWHIINVGGATTMSHVWCHGPSCHTYVTTDRVRGSKGSKVLRTRKVKQHTDRQWYNPNNFYNYFCSNGCYNDFANQYAQQIIRIAPRTEPLETPIHDPKKETTDTHWGSYTRTVINKIDNESNVG